MELSAEFSHEVAWEMCLLLELFGSMGIRASVTILAFTVHFEVSAKFSLLLALILLSELESFFRICELLFLSSSSSFTILKGLSHQKASISILRVIIETTVVIGVIV